MNFTIGHTVTGAGTPVVLLHSSMSSKAQWTPLSKQLQSCYQVIAIDLAGYGQTTHPLQANDFSLAHEIRLIELLLSDLIGDKTPFHLVGHSYGGATSLRLAQEHPERVLSLSLFEPVAFHLLDSDDEALSKVKQVIAHIDQHLGGDAYRAAEGFIDYWNGAHAFKALPEKVQLIFTEQIHKVRLDFQALMGDPLRLRDFENLNIPTCLISGKDSPHSTRRIIELLKQSLPQTHHHQVSGGHMAPISHADEVNAVLTKFLGV